MPDYACRTLRENEPQSPNVLRVVLSRRFCSRSVILSMLTCMYDPREGRGGEEVEREDRQVERERERERERGAG